MSEENSIWPAIAENLVKRNGPRVVFVGVHPTYGRRMVSEETFQSYMDGFAEAWQSGQNRSRILISSPQDHGIVPWLGGDYEITATFPDVFNQTGSIFDSALVFGSTAKTEHENSPGCVNLVSVALLDKGYAKKVRIIERATLFPGKKL